ncbi:MAG: hypothetical protein AAF718_16805 [Pseudomonadota bacterium]
MTIAALSHWVWPSAKATVTREAPPKADWPLMCDVGMVRAGVPEALILWRKARGETAPLPSDPDLRQNSL